MKKLLAFSAVALLLAACSGQDKTNTAAADAASAPPATASNDLLARIDNKGTVTVGTEGTYAPFTYHDEAGKLTGYDVEVTRAVAAKLGFTHALIPEANKPDLYEVDEEVKNAVKFIPVSDLSQVLKHALILPAASAAHKRTMPQATQLIATEQSTAKEPAAVM